MAIAVYAGTFDPMTLGHLSVVRAAARIFDHVRVLVAVNPDKEAMCPIGERVAMIEEVVGRMPQVSVDSTERFVVEYARDIGAGFLIRGLRTSLDADFEINLAKQNRELAPELATLLLPADPAYADISSTQVRQALQRGEEVSRLCPPSVVLRLAELSGGGR